MSVFKCTGVKKAYKKNAVLDGIDLTIEQGKIYGLIGRNGAGKTTLMSVMTAQTPADSGEITLDDMPVWENRKVLDHLCFSREVSTQETGWAGVSKVKHLLEIAAMFYPGWDETKAEQILDRYHIQRKDPLKKLSKGMLSIVTIAIGMASGADITILDEPTAGLDVIARKEFYKMVLSEAESGRTFVISTHIIEEAADVFEEVIFLHEHKILLKENTVDLLDRCRRVTGKAEVVEEATAGLTIAGAENIGRSRSVTVMLNEGERIPDGCDVTIQPVSLQDLFIALCGGEDSL